MSIRSATLGLALIGVLATDARAQSTQPLGATLGGKLFTSGPFVATGSGAQGAYFTRPLLLGLLLQAPTPISAVDVRLGVESTLGGRFKLFNGSPQRTDAGISGTYIVGSLGLVLRPPHFRGGLQPFATAGLTLSGWRFAEPTGRSDLTRAVREAGTVDLGWLLGGGVAWDLGSIIVAPELTVRLGSRSTEAAGTLPTGWRRSASMSLTVRMPLGR